MKTINYKLMMLLSVLLSALLFSCEKNDGNNQDTESPLILILAPTITQTYASGDTVHVQVRITDNDQLHDIFASITRTYEGATEQVWSIETHSHDDVFDLLGWYIVEAQGMHNDFVLSITASDHNGNEDTEKFEFHVMQ